ncbi:MAG: hypothetical protein ACSHYF_03375 [Verrucomicrobiaceae bacterium]
MPSSTHFIASRILRRSALNCPSCKAILETSQPACPRCGFHYGMISNLIPGPAPQFQEIMDFARTLPDKNTQIKSRLRELRGKFPQISLAICSVNCPDNLPPNLLAWWMLNETPDSGDSPEWRGLLLIDPSKKLHAFVSGYQLETFLARSSLERILDEAAQWFVSLEWTTGILTFLDLIDDELTGSCKIANKALKEAHRATKG